MNYPTPSNAALSVSFEIGSGTIDVLRLRLVNRWSPFFVTEVAIEDPTALLLAVLAWELIKAGGHAVG